MDIKKIIIGSFISSVFVCALSCGGNEPSKEQNATEEAIKDTTSSANGNPTYDPKRGEGKFKDVVITENLDPVKADSGKKVFDVKCSACHKLTAEKLVGPGWKGMTQRHEASWILNFIVNPDDMIDKDPELQAQLEICLVRMPNQSLTDEDARNVYEFMRKNDGVK
ncbi:MAG: c-type cytochrome [Bacteroidia bacterium]